MVACVWLGETLTCWASQPKAPGGPGGPSVDDEPEEQEDDVSFCFGINTGAPIDVTHYCQWHGEHKTGLKSACVCHTWTWHCVLIRSIDSLLPSPAIVPVCSREIVKIISILLLHVLHQQCKKETTQPGKERLDAGCSSREMGSTL